MIYNVVALPMPLHVNGHTEVHSLFFIDSPKKTLVIIFAFLINEMIFYGTQHDAVNRASVVLNPEYKDDLIRHRSRSFTFQMQETT